MAMIADPGPLGFAATMLRRNIGTDAGNDSRFCANIARKNIGFLLIASRFGELPPNADCNRRKN
jgi:hypothetical protein